MKDNVKIAQEYTDWHIKTGGFARDMTLRDHLAAKAMQGLMDAAMPMPEIADAAYDMADAMLKERAK